MTNVPSREADDDLALQAIKRADALLALRRNPQTRTELVESVGVSRTTIHRTLETLEAHGLTIRDGNEVRLSAFGRSVAGAVTTYRQSLRAAGRLKPLFETLGGDSPDIDPGLFTDATVTVVKPTDPYAPVGRFMELLRESSSLRGFDTTTIAPIYVDEIRDEILGGMQTDVVYLPDVVEDIVTAYPEEITAAAESGRLSLSTHGDLPFGLAIFDDRVGLGGYDDESGMLRVFVDTDDPDAREWALDRYRHFRSEADAVSSTPDGLASTPGEHSSTSDE